MPAILQAIDDQLQLASAWRMFIYRTIPNTGWLVVQGQFENGEQRLLYSGADAASGLMHRLWGPPARLRVLEQHLFDTSPSPILRAWGGYYCQTFNRGRVGAEEPADGARLVTATIYRHYRQAHAPGAAPNPYKDELLWTQRCLGG